MEKQANTIQSTASFNGSNQKIGDLQSESLLDHLIEPEAPLLTVEEGKGCIPKKSFVSEIDKLTV